MVRNAWWVVLVPILVSACGGARAPQPQSKPTWELKLAVDGQEVKIPLEIMDVFVTDNDKYPEIFEIRGEGVNLVGEFPLDVRVDYGEHWEVLFGKTIGLMAHGGEPGAESDATLTLPGRTPMRVVGGSLMPEKVSGELTGQGGDKTLYGRITIQVQDVTGVKALEGTFAVHCVTWG